MAPVLRLDSRSDTMEAGNLVRKLLSGVKEKSESRLPQIMLV